MPAAALMNPLPFGPRMVRPRRCARSATCRSSSAPSSPTSAKPEVSSTTDGMPASATSASTPSTAEVGTITKARSTSGGRSAMRA
jgi:hypothetical protein